MNTQVPGEHPTLKTGFKLNLDYFPYKLMPCDCSIARHGFLQCG